MRDCFEGARIDRFRFFTFTFALALGATASAAVNVDLAPIGRHHRLFRFDKNENPQNILYGFTRTDGDCRFETRDGHPLFDIYWMLDGVRYKNPHRLIKSSIRKHVRFLAFEPKRTGESDAFTLRLIESREMKSSLNGASIRISSSKTENGCRVETVASFESPAGGRRTIELTGIRSETRKTWRPPFRKIISITLEGSGVPDGRVVSQVFN